MSRTTITLDPDVAKAIARRRRDHGTSFKAEVNALIRAGLERDDEVAAAPERFRTAPLPLGAPLRESFDDIADVLASAEGERHR